MNIQEFSKDPSLMTEFEVKLFDLFDRLINIYHCKTISDVINAMNINMLHSLIANTGLEISIEEFRKYIKQNYSEVIKENLTINNEEITSLQEFVNQSPTFKEKFNKALLDSVKAIINKNSYLAYLEDMEINIDYHNVRDVLMDDVYDYYIYNIIDKLESKVDIPDSIKSDPNYVDNISKMMSDNDDIDRYYFKVWNDILLPLTKEKIKFLSDPNFDKIGDEHKLDIDVFDIMNRDTPFIIINKNLYIGKHYDEHHDISEELTKNNIDDKGKTIMYGHIVNDIAFVDLTRTINKKKNSLNTLREIINKEPNLQKAYTMPINNKIKRLAKILYKKVN